MNEKIADMEPENKSKGSSKSKLKLLLFVIIIVGVIASVKVFHLGQYLSIDSLKTFIEEMGDWAPAAFVLSYAVGMLIGLPGTLFTIAGGIVFGKWFGTLYNVIGATIGASGAFWIARLLASQAIVDKFKGQKWFDKFNRGLEENGLYYMLFIRLVPLFPFNGLNFGAGMTRVSFRNYFIGTAIGIIPATFVFTNAAAEIGESAAAGFKLTGGMVTALVLLGLFALIPIIIKRRIMPDKPESDKA